MSRANRASSHRVGTRAVGAAKGKDALTQVFCSGRGEVMFSVVLASSLALFESLSLALPSSFSLSSVALATYVRPRPSCSCISATFLACLDAVEFYSSLMFESDDRDIHSSRRRRFDDGNFHRVATRGPKARTSGRRKQGVEKTVGKTSLVQNNDANSLIKNESKLDIIKVTNKFDTVKTQFVLKPCKSPTYIACSCNQHPNAEDTKGKSLLTHYFFDNAQTASTCVQIKEESTSYVEQFKTDETPVAVPIYTPSTPHRIKMPSEELDEGAIITTKEKQSVIKLLSPLQEKKPAPRGRKKGTFNLSKSKFFNHRLSKVPNIEANHSITDYFPVRRSVRKSKKVVLEEKQRDLENKVLCQVEDGLEVRNFPGKGRGVITTREFAKGEFVVEYIGELISQGEAKEREEVYAQDQNTGCYMYYFQHRNQQYCVDATAETDKLGRLVNHSRTGNLIARIVEVNSIPHLVLTAKEDIPIGVEVTYDYGDRSRESIRHHPWLAL